MDLQSARSLLLLPSRRRRRWLLVLAAAGFTGYGAYRLYHLPAVVERRRRLSSLLRSLASLSHALASSAEAASLVSSDLALFLSSDSDELPTSLRQMAKIARSEQFASAISNFSEAVAAGVMRAAYSAPDQGFTSSSPGKVDRALDKLFSPAGTGFVSTVAGNFAKNLVVAFYDSNGDHISGGDAKPIPQWVRVMCSDEARKVMGECVQTFVGTAVEVYLKKTMDVNTYDQMFSGLTNPQHVERMKDLLVTTLKGATETLVRTSHEVLTSSNPSSSSTRARIVETGQAQLPQGEVEKEGCPLGNSPGDGGGLFKGVSSTLAEPSNRKFVLDVTGMVTFGAVKSVLDFMLWKMYDSVRSSIRAVGCEITEMAMEVMKFASAKSMLILTICFSMLLRVALGSKIMMAP